MELVLLNPPLMNRKPHLGYFVPELWRKLQYNISFGLHRLLQVVTVEVYQRAAGKLSPHRAGLGAYKPGRLCLLQ